MKWVEHSFEEDVYDIQRMTCQAGYADNERYFSCKGFNKAFGNEYGYFEISPHECLLQVKDGANSRVVITNSTVIINGATSYMREGADLELMAHLYRTDNGFVLLVRDESVVIAFYWDTAGWYCYNKIDFDESKLLSYWGGFDGI